ncbi:4-alpha-glucanotransferase [Dyella jejuensis]|uniref:4-alpha-glucanotransferase n=1 Tax=Dyella jejuensis TaxID=1432009 RepID=A0ABW8JLJ9_9GAMM
MSDSSLEALAHAAGIAVQWTDAFGQAQHLSDEALHGLLAALQLPAHDLASRRSSLNLLHERHKLLPALVTVDAGDRCMLPSPALAGSAVLYHESGATHAIEIDAQGGFQAPADYGYYRLAIGTREITLAVAPVRCFGVSDSLAQPDAHAWGVGAQVYALRHANDGGVGDSRAVAALAAATGRAGGDALALSPLHAISPIGQHYSPYSPSDRGFLNWLHADPAQLLGEAALHAAIQEAGIAPAWDSAHKNRLVDWPKTYAMRRSVWRMLYEQFAHAPRGLREDFDAFVRQGGQRLRDHALIAARQAFAALRGESTSWRHWEHEWQEDAPAADAFAGMHDVELAFETFLQWLAARCWERTQQQARDEGQRIGLIWDLAVGFEPGGGEAWSHRQHLLQGLELGAPPDAFNPSGQQWGITSYSPWGLASSGFAPFIQLLRANMARGGGVRIDHVIGFRRLWILPEGGSAAAGGYIRLPLEDMLRLVALESWRNRCIVIGEDLGTVPEGFRDLLAAKGLLGIDVLLFTRDGHGRFLPPERWRPSAIATTTTHDLPPLLGWREGLDIAHLAAAHEWPDEARDRRQHERQADVAQLDRALAANAGPSQALAANAGPSQALAANAGPSQALPPHADKAEICRRSFQYIARAPSPLRLIPLEDALCRKEQPNLPGTVSSYPNWRHRLPEATLTTLPPVLQSLGGTLKGSA